MECEKGEVLPQNIYYEVRGACSKIYNMHKEELQAKGDRLIRYIAKEWTEKGFICLTNFGHMEGNDIIVITSPGKECRIHAVIECKNYGPGSYVDNATFKKDMDNLNYFNKWPDVEKWLVISYKDCLSVDKMVELEQNEIKVREIGYEL